MNVHGPWLNLALMLGMEKDASLRQQFFEFVRRYEQFPGKMDHRARAPGQEVVIEKEVNLFELLPLFRLNQGDGGFYIDKACIVSRDPDDWSAERRHVPIAGEGQESVGHTAGSSSRHRNPSRPC